MTELDKAGGQHVVDLFFDFRFLKMRVAVRSNVDGFGVRKEVNLMSDSSGWW